jgi:hypothetical protein
MTRELLRAGVRLGCDAHTRQRVITLGVIEILGARSL